MNELEKREKQRKKSVISSILENQPKAEGDKDTEKKEVYISRTYRLREDQIKKLRIESATQDTDISKIVRDAIDIYFDIK